VAWPAGPPAPACAGGFQTYGIGATPVVVGSTGQRSFCTDESGVIRFDPTGAAAPTSDVACQAIINVIQ